MWNELSIGQLTDLKKDQWGVVNGWICFFWGKSKVTQYFPPACWKWTLNCSWWSREGIKNSGVIRTDSHREWLFGCRVQPSQVEKFYPWGKGPQWRLEGLRCAAQPCWWHDGECGNGWWSQTSFCRALCLVNMHLRRKTPSTENRWEIEYGVCVEKWFICFGWCLGLGATFGSGAHSPWGWWW